ncbi:hypothetical protein IAD21_04702 [Abditibacteriota bacterium]|nr:hypothetical protein IAD21_04702 [Abditibacteriota bacterium]
MSKETVNLVRAGVSREESSAALWQAIYVEPLRGSGERICVGVIVVSRTQHHMLLLPHMELLLGFYSKQRSDLIGQVIHLLSASIERTFGKPESCLMFFDPERRDHVWRPPTSNVVLGKVRGSKSDDLEDVADMALMMCASLYEGLKHSHGLKPASREEGADPKSQPLIKDEVKRLVVKSHEELSSYFEEADKLVPPACHFLGKKLAATFVELRYKFIEHDVDYIKSRIAELSGLRASMKNPVGTSKDNKSKFLPWYKEKFSRVTETDVVENFEIYVRMVAPHTTDDVKREKQRQKIADAVESLRAVATGCGVSPIFSEDAEFIAKGVVRAELGVKETTASQHLKEG